MKRIVNSLEILTMVSYLKGQIEELNNKKIKLVNDINMIDLSYAGVDATNFKNKYLENAKKIEAIIKTLNNYLNYYEVVATNYKENLENAVSRFNSMNESSVDVSTGQTINLNSIGGSNV